MTEFTCPRHGAYTRTERLPERVPASCPSCRTDARRALEEAQAATDIEIASWYRWHAAELPERYRNRTVANWLPQAGQEEAARMVAAWLDGLDERYEGGDGLLLMGAPGIGKTHLLAGLVTAIVERGYHARYASWPTVWEKCRPPFDDSADELLRDLAKVPFLALDELGMRQGSAAEQARLFELVDTRYREQLPTLVATNATEATLPLIGERTADRLLEACIPVAIPGSSYRTRAAIDMTLRGGAPAVRRPDQVIVRCPVSINGVDQFEEQFTRWNNGSLRA